MKSRKPKERTEGDSASGGGTAAVAEQTVAGAASGPSIAQRIADAPLVIAELAKIIPTPHNTRKQPTKAELASLCASLARYGQLQNGVARPHPTKEGRFELLAGERRLRGLGLIEAKTMKLVVVDADDGEAVMITIDENREREDLTPMEQAMAISELLKLPGATMESVADRLGKPVIWVAKRESLLGLSTSWRFALMGEKVKGLTEEAREILQGWPGIRLEAIARMPHEVQEAFFAEIVISRHSNLGRLQAEDIKDRLSYSMHEMSAAPWKLEDAKLVPQAGPCAGCRFRSSAQLNLFTEEIPGGKKAKECPDVCTQPKCWMAKEAAIIEAAKAEIEEKHGTVPILVREKYWIDESDGKKRPYLKGSVNHHEVGDISSKETDGAKPALMVEGKNFGKLVWVKKSKSSGERGSGKKSGQKKSLAEREKQLAKRRFRKAVELFFADKLESIDFSSSNRSKNTSDDVWLDCLRHIAAFGAPESKEDGHSLKYGMGNGSAVAKKLKNAGLPEIKRAMVDAVIRWFRLENGEPGILSGNPESCWKGVKECCAILNLDPKVWMDEAIAAIREPKGWAAERLEAANKAKAKKKGKSKPAGKAAKPKKSQKPADDGEDDEDAPYISDDSDDEGDE